MDVKVDMVQDSIGQLCPMPIAFMARNMKKMEAGQQTGNEFLGKEPDDGFVRYYVRKAG